MLLKAIAITSLLVLFALFQSQDSVYVFYKHTPGNCGHKGGYDCLKQVPENSLALLKYLEELQHHPKFKYLEFDIRETKDNKLVVFHDPLIYRMLPDSGYNLAVYKELRAQLYKGQPNALSEKHQFLWRVSDLTLYQLQSLTLKGLIPHPDAANDFRVPTLERYVDEFKAIAKKPVVFEIKSLHSGTGRNQFKDTVIKYAKFIRGNRPSGTRYNAFPYQQVSVINLTGLKRNFDQMNLVCEQFKKNGIDIYRGWTHDSLCDYFYEKTRAYSPLRLLIDELKEPIQRIAVKHAIEQVESELDPANYHLPRLVYYVPPRDQRAPRFVYKPLSQANEALEKLKGINAEKLIVLVHGRGRHPGKGEKMMAELAIDYDAAVLMFNWDSWICKSYCEESIKAYSSKYPVGNARAAAPGLSQLMKELSRFERGNPGTNISMLVHSMGNIVFKQMIECNNFDGPACDNFDRLKGSVFIDNLILNAADVDGANHKKWLEKVSFVDDIFVTTAQGDIALGAVETMLFKQRLGQSGVKIRSQRSEKPENVLAKNVHYIDFTKVGSSHRKFGKGLFHTRKYSLFFNSALGKDSWKNCAKTEPINMKIFDFSCTASIE